MTDAPLCPCARERAAFATMAEAERATFRMTLMAYGRIVAVLELMWWIVRGPDLWRR